MKSYVVTGIGTEVGKTVVSAVLCEALKADYWKPVQAGDLHALDSDFVKSNTSETTIIPANKLLNHAMSPHEAARLDGIELTEADFDLPRFLKQTIVEGAGGVMVPLNDAGLCYIDLFQLWELPVYVVTKHYLGSINHTLLTLNALMSREIRIAGLIVNGDSNAASERIYHSHFPDLSITTIPEINEFSKESIQQAAKLWIEQLH
ncbi:dethiobiotin synthase [Fluviicola chungangensis]|uniref:ATP-dependent dethiobiotin synthetase BioD n=1 Tax=Fluviicola chungangensis TaxID=2597671 RepID=A0A556MGB7_9FLAO|nr:dethiobiotin synthase [Fluviicola chungangensis]TSJ38971.1 dethiobiotin synthase [Fluviicola chungangensis]